MSCVLGKQDLCSSHGDIPERSGRQSVFGVTLESDIVYTSLLSNRTIYGVEGDTTDVLFIVEAEHDGTLLYMLSDDASTQPEGQYVSCIVYLMRHSTQQHIVDS